MSEKRKKIAIACAVLLLVCLLRGAGHALIWQGSFWRGFFEPIVIALAVLTVTVLLFLLGKKSPKAASGTARILLWCAILFLAGIFAFISYCLIVK